MPSYSLFNDSKSLEDDNNETFFSVGDRFSILPNTIEPKKILFPSAEKNSFHTPKGEITPRANKKEETTPNSDQENKPSNGFHRKQIGQFSFDLGSKTSSSRNRNLSAFTKVSNFLREEKFTDPIEHNSSIISIQSNFAVNPMFPSDIMGTAFDKASADIELLLDDFKKNVSLIKERSNIPTSKWDIKKHTLSEEFLKLNDNSSLNVFPTKPATQHLFDKGKYQHAVDTIINSIPQTNCQVPCTPQFSYQVPMTQQYGNGMPIYPPQQYYPQQNMFQPPSQQSVSNVSQTNISQQQHLPNVKVQEIEKTEEEIVAEEEMDRKILSTLEKLSRVEDILI
uniref:Uncharacterized protein n=1 Tax=Parastrongyloides trichosuri TaxID=131310 RepID=A0A0N4ZKC9_PARTI